ncbi:MAG: hypothetical protein IPL61_00815 [Myxococcales bacterium]|nr:hypothetical protein [Myxococcales bacterium]
MKPTGSQLLKFLSTSILAVAVGACGPSAGGGGDDDDDVPKVDASVNDVDAFATCSNPVPEICDNQIDDDCDNIADCDDADCSADAHCTNANCGQLQNVEGQPLPLPDGACDATGACAGYRRPINFTGFTAGQTLPSIDKLLGVCVTMEHSWLRDLTVALECPSGTQIALSGFQGRTGGEVYVGQANDNDSSAVPVPGVGWDYCWTPTATREPWITFANNHPDQLVPAGFSVALPSGDYSTSDPMANLVGCTLNGDWTIIVEDRWGIDNGYIFKWSVRFDPSLVEDCSMWPG